MTVRCFLSTLALALAIGTAAHAQFPTKPVRIIVPFAPGGAVDVIARVTAQKMTESMGQNVYVENRVGAGSIVGTEIAVRAAPDGYTLLMGAASSLVINPLLQKLSYDPLKDFVAVTLVGSVPHLLVTNSTIPVNNLKEFIAYANARPGQLNYGSPGAGTPHHIAIEMFKQMAGVNLLHVPYKGTGPAMIELLGGQIALMSSEILAALPHGQSGKLRVLGIATEARNPLAPEIQTVTEAGLPGFLVTTWYGVVAPAAVPKEIIAQLSQTISKALTTAEMREKLATLGATPMGGTPADFDAHLRRENIKWTKAVKESGVRLD